MEGEDEGTARIEIPYRIIQIQDTPWILSHSKTHLGRPFYFNTLTGHSVWNLSEAELQRARLLTGSNSKSTKTDIPKLHAEKIPQNNVTGRTINNQYVNPQESNSRNDMLEMTIGNQYVSQQYGYPSYRATPQSDQLPALPALLVYPPHSRFQQFPSQNLLPQKATPTTNFQLVLKNIKSPTAQLPVLPTIPIHSQATQPQFQQIPSQRLPLLPAIDQSMDDIRILASVQTTTKSMSDRFTKLKDNAHSYQEETFSDDHTTTSQFRVRSPVEDCVYSAQSIENAVRDNAQHYFEKQRIVKRRASYSGETTNESLQSVLDADNTAFGHRGSSNNVQNQNMTNNGGRIIKATSVRDLRLKLNNRKDREMIQNAASGQDSTITVVNIQNMNVAEKSSPLIQRSVKTSTVTVSGETPNTAKKRIIRLKRDLSSDGVANCLNPTTPIVHKRPFGKWRRHVNTDTVNSNKQQQQEPLKSSATMRQVNKTVTDSVNRLHPNKPDAQVIIPANKPDAQVIIPANKPDAQVITPANKTDAQVIIPANKPDAQVIIPANKPDAQVIIPANKPDAQVIIPANKPDAQVIPANKPNSITDCRTTTFTNNLWNKVVRSPKRRTMANSVNKSIIQAIKSPNKPDTVRVLRPTFSAKNSDKSSTRSTYTDILLNDVKDRMAKLSHNQMKERDAQRSRSASESVVSDSCVRKLNLSVASRFSTAVPESLAESDFISNSDAVSVLSENLSRFLTQTALMNNALSTCSAELVETKFEVNCPVMRENLQLRCDEFLSLFTQIMEEVLSQILQHHTISSKVGIPPPWTLHEATKCLSNIYPERSDVGRAASMFSKTLSSKIEDEYGRVRPHVTPSEYMDMFRYGVSLVDTISRDLDLRGCDEIPSAIQRLSELLDEIKKPRNSELLNESFNDVSCSVINEGGFSESNHPDPVVPSATTNCASRLQNQEPEKKQSPVKFHRSCNADADFRKKFNRQKRENENQISKRLAQDRMPEKAEQASMSSLKNANIDSGKQKDAFTEPTIKRQFRIDPELEKKLKSNGYSTLFSVNAKNNLMAPQPSTSDNQLWLKNPKRSDGNVTDRPMVKFPFTNYSELEESLENDDFDSNFDTDEDGEDDMNADEYEEDNYYEDGELINRNHENQQCDETFADDNDVSNNSIVNEYHNDNVTVIQKFLRDVHDSLLSVHDIGDQITTTTIDEISGDTLTESKKQELQETIEDAQTRIEYLLSTLNRVLDRETNGPKTDIEIKRDNSCYGNVEYSSFVDKIRGRAKLTLDKLTNTSNILSSEF